MPLGERLSASDLNLLILHQSAMQPSQTTHTNCGNFDFPYPDYYVGKQVFVLSSCSDAVDVDTELFQAAAGHFRIEFNSGLPTIQNALLQASTRQAVQAAFNAHQCIIIPVAEYQPFFGRPRNHYVTLHYDPVFNTATLIDSRPWLYSYLYSIEPKKAMLQAGIQGLELAGNPIAVAQLQFNCCYQSVQYNDIYCGYWTAVNIFALAGIEMQTLKNIPPVLTAIQGSRYTWKDEEEIVARVIAYAMAKSTQCEEGADGLESYLVVQRSLSHAKPKVAKEVVKKPPLVCQESDEFSDFLEVVADAVDVVADTSQTGVALRP